LLRLDVVDPLRRCATATQLSSLNRSEPATLLVDLFVEVTALKQVVGEQCTETTRYRRR
jgi:hypothetical protein